MSVRRSLPITATELRRRIARVPRIPLAFLPTPLEELPRLSEHLGVRVLMKRDDLTGLALGGNKARSLEFRLAEALTLGATDVVAVLDVQSNSARQTAAAANRLGMKTHLVLVGESHDWQGNLLLDALLGAQIRIVESGREEAERIASQIVSELESLGRSVYYLNEGHMFALGPCLAYALCMAEIKEQMELLGADPDFIYLSSSGKGQAGVMLGALVLGMRCHTVGIACHAAPDAPAIVAETVNHAADLLDLDLTLKPDEVVNCGQYAGEGYKVPTAADIEALQLIAQLEGILLDTVYTAKAMVGLIDHVRKGRIRPGQTVIFIHTGGVPVLFAHRDRLMQAAHKGTIAFPWHERSC